MIRSPLLTVMIDAARKAARSLRRDAGEVEQLQVSRKGPGDFVSLADKRAEEVVRETLVKARPTYGLVLEEGGVVGGTDGAHVWHVDPLDGTTNFLHGIPHYSTSIALERDGVFVAGVIYDMAKDEMFTAERGKGAYLNDRRIRVSGRRVASDALVGCGVPPLARGGHGLMIRELGAVTARFGGVRRLGVASLDAAYVACGRLDAYWERGVHTWDFGAGAVIVKEAGGFFERLDGAEDLTAARDVICGPEPMLKELKKAVLSVA